MEATHFHPSSQAEKAHMQPQMHYREEDLRKNDAMKPRPPHRSSRQMFRQETAPQAEQKSTIALICGWIVEHQLGMVMET
jgi:hypothetical protein